MAGDDDFVFTISDNEDPSTSDLEDSTSEPSPIKAEVGRKRKLQAEPGAIQKPQSRKRVKIQNSPPLGRDQPDTKAEATSSAEEGDGREDGAIDPDFTFELGGSDIMGLEDFDGWAAETPSVNKGESGAKANKKAVDLEEIIARRAAQKQIQPAKQDIKAYSARGVSLESEKALEIGGYEDTDEQEAGIGFPNFEDDELMANDGFGAGADSDDEDEESGSRTKGVEDESSADGHDNEYIQDDSDSNSVASPTAHPDDLDYNSDNSALSMPSEDDEEKAKRTAFFAPEEKVLSGKHKLVPTSDSNSFQSFSLSRPVLRGVAAVSFMTPTPIQKRTIPVALAGKDVVGSAVTGSGKTAAFLLPILERLLYRPRKVPTTRVAILLPTRELAVQCFNVVVQLAQYTDITFAQLVGGFSLREQEIMLKKRPDIVIATPGRFIDHMRNSPSFVIENIEILVLDEADRMLEDGFADELDEILKSIPRSRQTMLFSATMTESVDKLVRIGMNRPVRVNVDARKATVEGLVQEFVRLRPGREEKRMASLLLLCTKFYLERVIVFFRQKKEVHRARILFGLLGIKAGELHGSMSQEQRINAVSSFRSSKTTHLLATDLASRGLDIKNVQTVINYETPQTHEIYLHRVGRTARAGKPGRACTIAAEPDRKVVKAAVKSARAQGAKIVSRVLDLEEVDALDNTVQKLEEEVEDVLREEKEEKQLAQADLQLTRGENLVKHEKEIMARPRRTWFESERDKRAAKKSGREELNGPDTTKGKKEKRNLSGKDKKRLDDRRERLEGKVWRKGKGSDEAAKADKLQSKRKKGSRSANGTKGGKPRKGTRRR